MSHTPIPWKWDEPSNWHGLSARVCNEAYDPIAQVQLSGWPKKVGRANAEFIVKACNSHDVLVEALQKIAELEGDDEQQKFKLTRFQASQVARAALNSLRVAAP